MDLMQGEAFGFLGFVFRRLRSPWGRWWVQKTPAIKQRTRCCASFKDGDDDVRTALAEPFEVHFLDVCREGQLPGFLSVAVELAKLLRVHAQLARHLHGA